MSENLVYLNLAFSCALLAENLDSPWSVPFFLHFQMLVACPVFWWFLAETLACVQLVRTLSDAAASALLQVMNYTMHVNAVPVPE